MNVYAGDKDYIKQLQESIEYLKEEVKEIKAERSEMKVQMETMMRLIDKANAFVVGYDDRDYEITVEKRSDGKWAVVHLSYVLNDKDEWEYERLPSSRGEEFKKRTRFDFDIAMRKASQHIVSPTRLVYKPKMTEEAIAS